MLSRGFGFWVSYGVFLSFGFNIFEMGRIFLFVLNIKDDGFYFLTCCVVVFL